MSKKFKATKKRATPQSKHILLKGVIATIGGKMLNPGDSFTADQVSPERMAELKEKGLIRSTLTTEEKGTITK